MHPCLRSGLYAKMNASFATCMAVNESAAQDCTALVTTYGAKFHVRNTVVLRLTSFATSCTNVCNPQPTTAAADVILITGL